jgi:hypothetical protein
VKQSVSDPADLQLEKEPPGGTKNCKENMKPMILNGDSHAQKMDCNHFV